MTPRQMQTAHDTIMDGMMHTQEQIDAFNYLMVSPRMMQRGNAKDARAVLKREANKRGFSIV